MLAVGLWLPAANAAEKPSLLDLGIEQLMNMEVSTASRRDQPLSHTAAAAFVITREDIRRSGATNIPEALRLAPGVDVAQISASKWSVSIRGFSGRHANKLLVLLDGRTLYNPMFSGVYWEIHNPPLEDVERIEVIRGPGGTLWGANAVNGVINIITRHTSATRGGLADLWVGTQQQFGTLRWGGRLGESGDFRVFGKADRDDPFDTVAGGAVHDDFDRQQVGFRTDWSAGGTDQFTLQGDLIRLDQGQELVLPAADNPPSYHARVSDRVDVTGGNLLGRWERSLAVDSEIRVQAYWDYYERDEITRSERVSTFDLDMQHHLSVGGRNEIVWGLGYRHTEDEAVGNPALVVGVPESRSLNTYSGFAQDEYELLDNRVWLTFGAKIEHNDLTGWEWQPNFRALWAPDADQSVWASIARAVRTPSRGERDYRITLDVQPPMSPSNPLPLALSQSIYGSPDYGSERLIAYELGYRARVTHGLTLDAAVFYNDYDDLLTARLGQPVIVGSHLLVPLTTANDMEGHSYGAELALDWRPNEQWRVQPTLSLLMPDFRLKPSNNLPSNEGVRQREGSDPKIQFSLRTGWSPRSDLNLDLWLRSVSAVPGAGRTSLFTDLPEVDGYVTLDARIAWRPKAGLELALIGKNLLQPSHLEYIDDIYPLSEEVPRSLIFALRYEF